MGKSGTGKCEGRIMKEEAGDVADSKGGETTGAKGRVRPRFLSALSAVFYFRVWKTPGLADWKGSGTRRGGILKEEGRVMKREATPTEKL